MSFIKSFLSEGTKVTDFNPFTRIKKVIAVMATPPKTAPTYLYLFSYMKSKNQTGNILH
jgi:hypothetical protein